MANWGAMVLSCIILSDTFLYRYSPLGNQYDLKEEMKLLTLRLKEEFIQNN